MLRGLLGWSLLLLFAGQAPAESISPLNGGDLKGYRYCAEQAGMGSRVGAIDDGEVSFACSAFKGTVTQRTTPAVCVRSTAECQQPKLRATLQSKAQERAELACDVACLDGRCEGFKLCQVSQEKAAFSVTFFAVPYGESCAGRKPILCFTRVTRNCTCSCR